MLRGIKFVALFMLTFIVFDVCSAEPCEAKLLVCSQSSQFQTQGAAGSDSCQFEEDCFNCAHYAPGAQFVLAPIAVLDYAQPELIRTSIERPLVLPYHPPRP